MNNCAKVLRDRPPTLRERLIHFLFLMGKGSLSRKRLAASKLGDQMNAQKLDDGIDDRDIYSDDGKEETNKAENLIKESRDDYVIQARARVGKKQKPYLGKRVTQPSNPKLTTGRREGAEELIDFITEFAGKYNLAHPECAHRNGESAIAMVYEFYGKHNREFYPNKITWLVAHAKFFEFFILKLVLRGNTLQEIRTRMYKVRSYLSLINSAFGPAFLPHNYKFETINGKREKVYLLRIPINQLKRAQTGFNSRYGFFKEDQLNGSNGEATNTDDVRFARYLINQSVVDPDEFSEKVCDKIISFLATVVSTQDYEAYWFQVLNDDYTYSCAHMRLSLLLLALPDDYVMYVQFDANELFFCQVTKDHCNTLNGNNGEHTGDDDLIDHRALIRGIRFFLNLLPNLVATLALPWYTFVVERVFVFYMMASSILRVATWPYMIWKTYENIILFMVIPFCVYIYSVLMQAVMWDIFRMMFNSEIHRAGPKVFIRLWNGIYMQFTWFMVTLNIVLLFLWPAIFYLIVNVLFIGFTWIVAFYTLSIGFFTYRVLLTMFRGIIYFPALTAFKIIYLFETTNYKIGNLTFNLGDTYCSIFYFVIAPLSCYYVIKLLTWFFGVRGVFYRHPLAMRAQTIFSDPQSTEEDTQAAEDYMSSLPWFGVFDTRPLRGGGLINIKVKNKGTGGFSKVKRDPQAPAEGVDHAREVMENLEADDDDYYEDEGDDIPRYLMNFIKDDGQYGTKVRTAEYYKEFIYSETPNLKKTFTREELVDNFTNFHEAVSFDCHGAPFCGLVSIDLANGRKPNLQAYVDYNNAEAGEFDNGIPDFLKKYANSQGLNLCIIVKDNLGDVIFTEFLDNNPGWRYVCLIFNTPEGEEPTECIGHWTLYITNQDLPTASNANGMFGSSYCCYSLLGLVQIFVTFNIVETFTNLTSSDHRISAFRRDTKEEEPLYARLQQNLQLRLFFGAFRLDIEGGLIPWLESFFSRNTYNNFFVLLVKIFTVADYIFLKMPFGLPNRRNGPMRRWFYLLSQAIAPYIFNEYNITIKILYGTFKILAGFMGKSMYLDALPGDTFVVNITSLRRVLHSAESMPGVDKSPSLMHIGNSRFSNDDHNMTGVIANTLEVAKLLILNPLYTNQPYNVNRIAVNANNCDSILGNGPNFVQNQLDGLAGGSSNYVKSYKTLGIIRNKSIASQPLFSVFNNDKQLGPGRFCVSDSIGNLMAFCGRSMCLDSEAYDEDELEDFSLFFDKLGDKFIKTVSLIDHEADPTTTFRNHYKGKKSQTYIDSVIKAYEDYKRGDNLDPKYKQNKCFVKMENSCKLKKGRLNNRPRLIMVMSDLLLVEYIHLLSIIEKWNEGAMKSFQIKHISRQEMVEKVMLVTSRDHIVTDYSSFEASISGDVRKCETNFMVKLAKLNGLSLLTHTLLDVIMNPVILHTKGAQFRIDSRNSGRFDTSFMNGVVNLFLNLYCLSKKDPNFELSQVRMVVEGDDGLKTKVGNEEEILSKLNFSFSEAVEGKMAGDVDFLRTRWFDNFTLLNIARCLKFFWVISNMRLNRKKALAILRCAALSLHHLSPNHPVLCPIIDVIGKYTAGFNKFKGMDKYVKELERKLGFIPDISKPFPEMKVNDEMRLYVAMGAVGFPPIPISVQLQLENQIKNGNWILQLCGVLNEYPEIQQYEDQDWLPKIDLSIDGTGVYISEDVKLVLETLNKSTDIKDKIKDFYFETQQYKLRFEEFCPA